MVPEWNSKFIYFYFAGKDLIIARRRAKQKLIEEDDMLELLRATEENIKQVVEEDENANNCEYTEKQAIKLRDNLIAAGAIRLARRSKEIMHMQLKEVLDAEEVMVLEEKMFIVMVSFS